jgi:hypothetical protein
VFRPTPEQQLGTLLTAHPELTVADTITVRDTVVVAKVEVRTRYVAVPNVQRERRDSLQLDSLLNHLSAELDTAQRKAAQSVVHRLLRQRPHFPDTLCFDTLGVHGRIWQQGNVYQIRLTRDAIKAPVAAKAVVARLKPCTTVTWYDPRTWPWLWVLAGFAGGILLSLLLRRS